jgi:hypothetical protein
VRDQFGVARRGGFGVLKHIDSRGDRGESASTVGCPARSVGKFDADSVLRHGDRRDRQFVVVQLGTVNRSALVSDENVRI